MFPALLGFLLITLLSKPDWQVELDWATRLTAASLLVVSPVVAAVAAFDTSSRLRPTLALLDRASVRTPGQIALPAAAVVTWAVASYLVTWIVAAVLVVMHSGIGIHDWWVFPEVLVPLLAAAAVGLLAGMTAGPRVAPFIAMLAVVAALIVASPWGRGPFEAVSTYGTLTGLERTPQRAAAVVVSVLVLALSAFLVAVETNRARGVRRIVLGACVLVVAVATVAPAAWPWKADIYRFTTEPYGCVGSAPAVCGPRSRLPLLRPVQRSLAKAYTTLSGTDFVKPTAFRVTRIDHYSQLNGAAPLDFDPADIHDGLYSDPAVASALVRPHQCAELFTASSAAPLLDAQGVIIPWLTRVLAGRTPATPVPADVSSAFVRIETCRVMTWNLH